MRLLCCKRTPKHDAWTRTTAKAEWPNMPSSSTSQWQIFTLEWNGFEKKLPCEAKRPSMDSSRTLLYILQCTVMERRVPCEGQRRSPSKFQRPEHVFTRAKISTNFLINIITPILAQTRVRVGFVLWWPRAGAFVRQNHIYHNYLIVVKLCYVALEFDRESVVLWGPKARAQNPHRECIWGWGLVLPSNIIASEFLNLKVMCNLCRVQ